MTGENRPRSRRTVLAAVGATAAALAGCTTNTENESPPGTTSQATTTLATDTTTQNTTEQTTTTVDDKSFEEIYMETVNEPWELEDGMEITTALRPDQVDHYQDPSKFDSFGDMMIEIKDDVGGNFSIINDSQEFTKHMQHAVHNDLGLSPDEVRVLGRDTAGGGTYTAIFHKNEDGDWVKDLALPFSGEGSYLSHNETKEDIDFSDEAEAGLWNIWKHQPSPIPATDYSRIRDIYEKDSVSFEEGSNTARWLNKGNDHIVVGEPYEEATVGYTAEAAQRVEELQDWHENDTFNEEMAMVEQATETWHNSEEPYIRMEMEDGEVAAVPTEEYHGAENLYAN